MIDASPDVRRMKLSELNPSAYNQRKISENAYQGLSGSIDKFGLLSLIVWNERSGNIVGGHQRYHLLVEKGEEETDVVVVDLDDNDEVALNITLNNPEIRGDFDEEVVALLAKAEVQLGNAFADIGLDSLGSAVSKLKWNSDDRKDKSGLKEPSEPSEPSDPFGEESNEPEAIVECPECHALWRLEDNELIARGMQDEDVEN